MAWTVAGGGDRATSQGACFALESQLMQLQARGMDRHEGARAQMLRQRMARSGCGASGPAVRSRSASVDQRRGGRRTLSRQTAPRSHALRRDAEPVPQSQQDASPGATYRTMCVRTCDGYYFPVSFSTTRDRFSDDAETCARMCPEASVALYHHSAAGEMPEEMVSIDGAHYSALPTAFRYRESLDAACSCGRPSPPEETNRRGDEAAAPEARLASLPRPRPAPAQDPETIANRLGGFAVSEVEPTAFASPQGRFGRSVRVVGPATTDSAASDLLLRPVAQ